LAVGLGDAERERRLLPALGEGGDFAVAARCLSGDELLACVHADRVDAALVAADLHRLAEETLAELARAGVPLVLLVAGADDGRWEGFAGQLLPPDAAPDAVRRALLAAVRGERPRPAPRPGAEDAPTSPAPPEPEEPDRPGVLVVAGGGSPGRTTVAVNLAFALGAVAPTVLVDADLAGPSVAVHLDLDWTRNLYMLAHAGPAARREWDRAIAQETQPLGKRSPLGVALCGVPKPEMRTAVSAGFVERLVAELRRRYRYVVLDVGPDLLGVEAAPHRAALALGQHVLLAAAADLVGLWHARTTMGLLQNHVRVAPERVALVVTGHDRRHHQGRGEIEWALRVPAVAVIPHDHGAAQRALAAQRPLVLDRRSRAGRALLGLAERVHGEGRLRLPAEGAPAGRALSVRWPRWPRLVWSPRPAAVVASGPNVPSGGRYGDDAAAAG
jgi:Mrp family chromosome partitioning ATPase